MTSTNMFAYCGNNPVNRYDPNGEAFFTATICGVALWKESRQILRDVGIEPVIDQRNLVVLSKNYYVSLHTTAYHNNVTERLRLVAGDKAGVEATLASLKEEILARSVAGIRWD